MKLIGKKIVGIRYQNEKEMEEEYWTNPAIVIELDDGSLLYPSQDEEGNGPGEIFLKRNGKSYYVLPGGQNKE